MVVSLSFAELGTAQPQLVAIIIAVVIVVIDFVVIVFLWCLHWNNVGKVNVPMST